MSYSITEVFGSILQKIDFADQYILGNECIEIKFKLHKNCKNIIIHV